MPTRCVARSRAAARRGAQSVCRRLPTRMRERRLTLRRPVLCPFLRPFFLDARRRSARVVARGGDAVDARRARRARPRSATRGLLAELGAERGGDPAGADRSRLRDDQHRGARRRVHPARLAAVRRVQRASRRRAPATASGWRSCSTSEPLMAPVPRAVRRAASTRPIDALLDALVASYREWGGTRQPAADRDRRLARGADVQRVRDPARRVHRRSACRRSSAIRAIWRLRRIARSSPAASRDRPRLPPRADQRHRRARRRVPRADRRLPSGARSASPTRCAARSRTRRRSSPC